MKRKLEEYNHNINYFYQTISFEPSLLIHILKYFKLSEIENIYRLLYTELKNEKIYTVLENHINKNYLDNSFIKYNHELFMMMKNEYKIDNNQLFNIKIHPFFINYQKFISTKNIVFYGLCQLCKTIPSPFNSYEMVIKVQNNNKIELEPDVIILCNDCTSKKYDCEIWDDCDSMKKKTKLTDYSRIIAQKYKIRTDDRKYNPRYFLKDVNERIILQQLQNELIEIQNKINLIKKDKF